MVGRRGGVSRVISCPKILVGGGAWRPGTLLLAVVGPRNRKVRQLVLRRMALLLGVVLAGAWVGRGRRAGIGRC